MKSIIIAIPWKSENGYLSSDLVIESLDKCCKKKRIKWQIAGEIVKMDKVFVRKIEFSGIPISNVEEEQYKEELKTSIHALCCQKLISIISLL